MDAPYRQPQEPPARRVLQICDLLPETAARLGQSCRWRESPGLLGSDRPLQGPRWPRLTGGLSALAALGFFGWIASGATGPGAPWRVGVLWALVLATILSARVDRRWKKDGSAHLEPGLYLFARELLCVRSTTIEVHPTEGIKDTRRSLFSGRVLLIFRGGERFKLDAEGNALPALGREIARVRGLIERAEAVDDQAALDILDPLRAERARWGRQPAAGRATPSEWPGRARAAAGAGLLALGLVLVAEGGSIYRAAATQDSDTLARLTRARTLLAGQADAAWLRLALDSRDERRLVHYSIAGQQPGRAREALAAIDGGRCQSDACWDGVRDACSIHGRLDVGLLERSMPYRSNGSPIPLSRFARWCPEALPYRELARLDLRNASLSPPMLQLLWSYSREPDYGRADDDEVVLASPATQKPRPKTPETPEQREIGAEARASLQAVYAAEREEVRRREPSPWAQAQGPLLELLATRDTDVSFKVRHEHAPAPVKPDEIPAEITNALRDHGLRKTSPLLRLHETRELLRETPTLTLQVTWQQRTPDESPQATDYAWVVTVPTQPEPLRFSGKFPAPRALPAADPAAFAAAFF